MMIISGGAQPFAPSAGDAVWKAVMAEPIQNRLGDSTSPYLLQHQSNPVHWQPWDEAALAYAKRHRRPILLSIGYAACHWCHVMAKESFADPEVAVLMNRDFVNIKVDREERPDIDMIYMSALQLFGVQGGWPLTMFLTPDAEPFWGGTYFPKHPQFGQPSFSQVLHEVARIFREEPEKIEANREAVISRLARSAEADQPQPFPAELSAQVAPHVLAAMDMERGGLRGAPKFPQTALLMSLWRHYLRSGEMAYRDAVVTALEKMALGGIYDHLGGGFARYSTDADWLVPHFEKMLYDNALLINLYSEVYRETRSRLFADVVAETIGWLQREMLSEVGGFCSSLDADSEGEEGRYYVWDKQQIVDLLEPEDADLLCAHYDVTDTGNWEGKTILNRLHAGASQESDVMERLAALRLTLRRSRDQRIAPARDDKLLADWNGLMIGALCHAGFVFARDDWVTLAAEAYDAIRNHLLRDGRFYHAWRDGRVSAAALLGDYAMMAHAAISLYQRRGDPAYLDHARRWMETVDQEFAAPHGGYYVSAADQTDVIVRPFTAVDDATPNANAVMAENWLQLAILSGGTTDIERAERIFSAFAPMVSRQALAHASLINAHDGRQSMCDVSVFAGEGLAEPGGANTDMLLQLLRERSLPDAMIRVFPPHPIIGEGGDGRVTPAHRPAVTLCDFSGCSLPLSNVDALSRHIDTHLAGRSSETR